jgi:hypothetical protein
MKLYAEKGLNIGPIISSSVNIMLQAHHVLCVKQFVAKKSTVGLA